MEQMEIKHLTFSYEKNHGAVLQNVSFSLPVGKISLLIGASGCGKTTLLRHLKTDFVPNGVRNGAVFFRGKPLEELSPREQASKIGFVGQNVDASYVTDLVWHELAFGLEGLGYSQAVMQRKVAEMTAFFGLERIYHMPMDVLSGGQKQMVNLASVMVMEPEVLILDEPTSQLDPIAANEFFEMIRKIHRELGTTILMTEHRLEEAFSLCDQVLVMDKGALIAMGTPGEVANKLHQIGHCMEKALPSATRLYFGLEQQAHTMADSVPLQVGDGSVWFAKFYSKHPHTANSELERTNQKLAEDTKTEKNIEKNTEKKTDKKPEKKAETNTEKKAETNTEKNTKMKKLALQAKELWFRYEKNGEDVLKAASIALEQGKITALLGGNGTGKSTFLNVLAGCEKAYDGTYKQPKQLVRMPQNPQAMFAKKTVLEELGVQTDEKVKQVIVQFGLENVLTQHPYDLSGGEMQKLALAKLILLDADILLLDEPGKGMDYATKEEMGNYLKQLALQGKTILMVSHDVEFCARFADVCGLFFDGHVVSVENTKEFFCENVFYTTAIRRIVRKQLPQAVVLEDVLTCYPTSNTNEDLDITSGGSQNKDLGEAPCGTQKEDSDETSGEFPKEDSYETKETRMGSMWNQLFSMIILLVGMPVTIYIGEAFLHQRKYYFISLLLVLEAIAMFWLRFEKRKPKVREIMIVANLCALTAASRAAFYMLPSVKPVAALVIISAACLGGEVGFMVGSFSMLISNIFFGQGPWTPWQMFAMGAVGYLAGVIFKQGVAFSYKRKIGMCIYGLVAIVVIYGGIMNPASVIMYQENVNWSMLLVACGAGLPFDLVHGISTVIFLLLGARIMTEKLERVKKKIGIV